MAREQSDVVDVHEYTEFVDIPAKAAAQLLKEHGGANSRIGFEARRLPSEAHHELSAGLPNTELVPIDDELERLQSVKTDTEVDMSATPPRQRSKPYLQRPRKQSLRIVSSRSALR